MGLKSLRTKNRKRVANTSETYGHGGYAEAFNCKSQVGIHQVTGYNLGMFQLSQYDCQSLFGQIM